MLAYEFLLADLTFEGLYTEMNNFNVLFKVKLISILFTAALKRTTVEDYLHFFLIFHLFINECCNMIRK